MKYRLIWLEYDFGFEPSEALIVSSPFSYLFPVK